MLNSAFTVSFFADSSFHCFQETHIMHKFKEDFYGSELSVVVLGYIRPEKSFSSLGKYHPIASHYSSMWINLYILLPPLLPVHAPLRLVLNLSR